MGTAIPNLPEIERGTQGVPGRFSRFYGSIQEKIRRNSLNPLNSRSDLEFLVWGRARDPLNSNEMQTTMRQVRTIVAGVLSLQEDCISNRAKIREELGADSLDLVAMITICAQTFAIKVCDEGAHDISTISDIATYIVLNKTREKQRNGA